MNKKPKILLIFPPVSFLESPHPAIPALAAYLRLKGVDVACLDANIEFFHHFLTEENIVQGRRYAEDRFLELNDRLLRTTDEKTEYFFLGSLLAAPEALADAEMALSNTIPYTLSGKQTSLGLSVLTASAPYFPALLQAEAAIHAVKYSPPGNRYSTRDIFRSLDDKSIFSGFFEKMLPSFIDGKNYDVVGISLSFDDQIHAAFHCAKVIRRLLPHTHIVMGGTYVTAGMSRIEEPKVFDYVDSLVMEDGEEPLEALVREVGSGRPGLNKVPSLVYRDGDVIRRNPVKAPIPLTSLPCPDYHVFPLERYSVAIKDMGVPFRTTRGCYWGKCTYCRPRGTYFCEFEQSPADHMYKNLLAISEATGATYFNFADNVTDPAVLDDFSKMLLACGKKMRWTTNLRLDKYVTLERCLNFRKAGCTNLFLGVESFNQRLLNMMEKGTTVEMIERVLSNTFWANIYVFAFMMVGLPTETEDEARADYSKLMEFMTNGFIKGYAFSPLMLFPGSKHYHDPGKYGIRNVKMPEGQDLDGLIGDFETEGMDRQTVFSLAREFKGIKACDYPMEVEVKGNSIPLKHGVADEIVSL